MKGYAQIWRLGHRPALDGVRGLAIALVLIGHALMPDRPAASVGVILFFVLSGFLITSLLWEELADKGRIDIRAFYLRRVRRLLPAFAVVSVIVLASMVAIGRAGEGLFVTVIAASYLSNWVMAGGEWLGPMSHAWSLSLEEQFYFAWPVLFLLGLRWIRPSRLIWLLIAGVIVVEGARAWAILDDVPTDRLRYATELRADGLLVGCALGVLMHVRPVRLPSVTRPIALAVLLLAALTLPLTSTYAGSGNAIAVAASGLLVLALVSSPGTDAVFENRWLGLLGLISYGLYLWHFPIMWHLGFGEHRPQPGLGISLIGIALSIAAALASYVWVERPFRHTRRRPERHPVPEVSPA